MKKTVVIARVALDPKSWETFEVEDVGAFLMEQFETWPATARIYHKQVAEDHDVTPTDEASADRLQTLEGPFFVVVYPGTTAVIITVIAVAAAIAAAYFFRPKIPDVITPEPSETINNKIAERQNKARPKERIPDIFGTVRATPDLIAVPYRIFKYNAEYEYSYMCIGRGAYDVSDLREDKTPIPVLDGSGVKVFGPNTSPNSGSPQYEQGDPIEEGVNQVIRSSAVDGNALRPPNLQFPKTAVWSLRKTSRDSTYVLLTVTNMEGESLRDYFFVGGQITLDCRFWNNTFNCMAWYWNPVQSQWQLKDWDLSGTYNVTAVTDTTLTFEVPSNSLWHDIFHSDELMSNTYHEDRTRTGWGAHEGQDLNSQIPNLICPGLKWVGPFVLDMPDMEQILSSFVAEQGMFAEDTNYVRWALGAIVRTEATPINEAGEAIGEPIVDDFILYGSSSRVVTQRGETRRITLSPVGRYSVRACRVSETRAAPGELPAFEGSVVDPIVWRDLYGLKPITTPHFGNVTTVQVVTRSSVVDPGVTRKFNCLVTRKIPKWTLSGGVYVQTPISYATNRVDDILPFVCLDPFIGARAQADVDIVGIKAVIAAIETYFGHEYLTEFNYSFDDMNISFEETVNSIASAVFCLAYRRGSQIKIAFEKSNPDSVLLFNHRNKIPGTESRTVRFGVLDDNDGVEFTYVDHASFDDDAKVTFYLPADMSATRPKRIESVGVTHRLQAYVHAWRAWNKIRYQNTTLEFDATQEANLLLVNDRILVADNTRPETQDGQVEGQNLLELTLSQNVTFAGGSTYHIFLQHVDGSVESLVATAGSAPNKVLVASPPSHNLSLDEKAYAKATFLLVKDGSPREATPFLVTELDIQDTGYVVTVKAVNYDDRYYERDQDFVGLLVDENGYESPAYHAAHDAIVGAYGSDTAADDVLAALKTFVNSDLGW